MQTLTHPAEILRNAKPGTFGQVVTVSAPKLTKKHRDTGELAADLYPAGVVKRSTLKVMCGTDYESCVNIQRERESAIADRFESLGLPAWAETDDASWPVYRHKATGAEYIRLHVLESLATVYTDSNGDPLPEDAESKLAGFLPVPRKDSGRQGVEKAVKVIGPKVESIASVKAGGQTYAG